MYQFIHTSCLENADDATVQVNSFSMLELAQGEFKMHVRELVNSMLDNEFLNCKMSIHKYKAVIQIESVKHVLAVKKVD